MTEDALLGSTSVSMLIGAPVAAVAPDASLHEVADAMVAAGVGALIVTDGNRDGAAGIVSERDIVGALAGRRDPATTHAGDIANTALVELVRIGECLPEPVRPHVGHGPGVNRLHLAPHVWAWSMAQWRARLEAADPSTPTTMCCMAVSFTLAAE